MVSRYAYTYDERGFIVGETATESLAGYAWDEKHDGKHEDGRHDALYPHGNKHAKHGKDSTYAYQIVETVRTFTYDGAGKLLSTTETEENRGTHTYAYGYDAMGNRTSAVKTDEKGKVVESSHYTYNESSQLISVELYDGKKTTTVTYAYDADGNLISETGRDGTEKVEKTYLYAVENRLLAVYDGKELLMAAAYDGDGNRVFQLNYNLHTDGDLKGNSGNGNGNGSNKDNGGSGNSGNNGNGSGSTAGGSNGSGGNSSGSAPAESVTGTAKNNGNAGNSSANNGKGGNGKDNGNKGNNGNGNGNGNSGNGNNGNGNGNNGNENGNSGNNGNSGSGNGSSGSGDGSSGSGSNGNGSTGNGNATNAETNNSQNRCGILFPTDSEVSAKEEYLISLIKTSGKEKNYELIEYISDVNRTYAEVLVEQNCNGAMDTAYVYGTDRLSLDRFDGSTGCYLYDPKGNVTGITNGEGQICLSYRYSAFGEITYGAPQYENIYAYNGESYNPNVGSLYLRARYYNVAAGAFFTEDSYLGNLREPLTLNRYVYCVGNPVNYVDPSGKYTAAQGRAAHKALQNAAKIEVPVSLGIGYWVETEYPVTGYMYSATGAGSVDILLHTPQGGLEVYEIKPACHSSRPDTVKPEDVELIRAGRRKLLPGRAQRLGYVQALKDLGYNVNVNGNSFNPNGWVLPINDPEYTHARYFTLAAQPGMIYYELIKRPEKEPVRLPVLKKIEEAKERSAYVFGCVLQPVRIGSSRSINVDLPKLQWAWQADVGGALYYLLPGVGELLRFAVPALAW